MRQVRVTRSPSTGHTSRRHRVVEAFILTLVILVISSVGTALFVSTQIVDGAFSVKYQKANAGSYNVDTWAYEGDPKTALGLAYRDVTYETELGDEPAWLIPGQKNGQWVVLVHGKGGERAEMLRNAEFFHKRGDNVLIISYRNDVGSPEDPSGIYQYGRTEVSDLAAAVDYLRDEHDADDIVLFGNSAGGGIVLAYLQYGSKKNVRAAILDSPIIDLRSTIDWNMKDIPLPGPVLKLGRAYASADIGVNLWEMSFPAGASRNDVPILILHGTDDEATPISESRRMADSLHTHVTLVEFPGAGHCESWNSDRAKYDTSLSTFLDRLP